MSGVLYVIEQLGQALAEANRRIAEKDQELTQLRAGQVQQEWVDPLGDTTEVASRLTGD